MQHVRNNLVLFWSDESGIVDASSYLLMVTIIAIGMIVGLTEMRNEIVQSMGDVAGSLENLDQSYSFAVGAKTSVFADTTTGTDVANAEPAGISIQEAASDEG